MKLKNNLKRILSGVMSLAVTASIMPCFPAFADEQTVPEKYPYTMFAASNTKGAITINADSICINGSIASNGSIVTTSPNFNVNGTKTENANEEMIYIQKKLNYSYFSGENVEMYVDDYTLEEINININNPMNVNGILEMTGNINLNSGIKALEDVNLNGEVKNTNNSVIFSETGDININTSNTNFSGLIYAPYGDIVIDTDNLNLNNVVIIGQTITLDCPSINANYSTYMAELIGTESDIDVELYAMGEYNRESNNIDIEWYSNYINDTYEIWTSDDNENYTYVDVVSDETTYQYPISEDFEKRYFKVSFTTNYGEYIESVPFVVTKTEESYSVDFLDSDEDGLPDIYEIIIGTDVNNSDTDEDGLTDYQEVYITGTNPMKYDSVTDGISDADADSDGDGISNVDEINYGTNPQLSDTDEDGLSDYDEIYVYGTDPLIADTDGDTLTDSDEIALGLNPLLSDSYNDGINDSERKLAQTISYTESDNDLPIEEVNISFDGTGYINSTTSIETDDTNVFVSNLLSIIGKPFRFESISVFDEATISFVVDKTAANVQSINELGVVWYDEAFHQFRMLECNYDENLSTIITKVPHFSIYCVVNREEWINAQGNYYFIASDDLTDNDNDKIPDCYESSNTENPENMYILSNGTATFSLKGEAHSDKQLTRDTIYDVVTITENGVKYYTDGIIDGEEIVFCTGGDVNCDNIVDNADVALLESYLAGNETLSAIEMVNADCNLDGKIDDDDIDLIRDFIENGYNTDTLSDKLGDINGDGVVSAADLRILADYILGRPVLYPVTLDRADFTGDGKIDVFDLVLMRQYLVNHSQSIAGFSYFYYVSDPMKNDTDGDLDWDHVDPDPMQHQLNGYFAQKMGELQLAAQDYLKSFSNCKGDNYYNSKDVWLTFYYLRCLNKGYTDSKWSKTAGKEEEFINFINTNKQYLELKNYFGNINNIYATKSGDIEDVKHFGAVVSALSYYPTIGELLPDNASFLEILGAALLLNRKEVNSKLDILASWGGDLQQLMEEAYNSTINGDISDKVAILFGTGKTFALDDAYADIDAEIISNSIITMYRNRNSFNDNLITKSINECFQFNKSERFTKFSKIVNLNHNTIVKAEKIDLASEYGISNSYRIFKHPKDISETDYQNIAVKFLEKINSYFMEV